MNTNTATVATFASPSLDTAAAAKIIRSELRRVHGWTSRDVSVRIDRYSMGSSIRVSIRRLDIPLAEVERIAGRHERVRYCQVTGEILSGGNMYVSTSYSHEALDAAAEPIAAALRVAGRVKIRGTEISIEPAPGKPGAWEVYDFATHRGDRCYSAGEAARRAIFYATTPVVSHEG